MTHKGSRIASSQALRNLSHRPEAKPQLHPYPIARSAVKAIFAVLKVHICGSNQKSQCIMWHLISQTNGVDGWVSLQPLGIPTLLQPLITLRKTSASRMMTSRSHCYAMGIMCVCVLCVVWLYAFITHLFFSSRKYEVQIEYVYRIYIIDNCNCILLSI